MGSGLRGRQKSDIVYFGNLAWRSAGSIGDGSIHVFENDTGPDDANHAQEGLYIVGHLSASKAEGLDRAKVRGPLEQTTATNRQIKHTWHAVAPTMLDLLGLDVPADMTHERLEFPG